MRTSPGRSLPGRILRENNLWKWLLAHSAIRSAVRAHTSALSTIRGRGSRFRLSNSEDRCCPVAETGGVAQLTPEVNWVTCRPVHFVFALASYTDH